MSSKYSSSSSSTRPPTHHTGCRPPTPQRLPALRHHRGPARNKAPDENVGATRQHNDTRQSTTRPQQPESTRNHLPGGRACPAKRMQQPHAPGPSNASAPCAHKRAQARAPPATRVHNHKRQPTRPHAATGQRPRHRPSWGPTRTTAHQSNRRQAPQTHRLTALPLQLQDRPPHRHVQPPRPTPPAPGPSDPSPTPPGAPVPRLRRHPAHQPRRTIHQPRRRPNRHPINARNPPAGPAVRPTEAPSGSPPSPSPDPNPDPTRASVPADAPQANTPGHRLPTVVTHRKGATPAARPAAAEGSGRTRTLAGHMGSQPRPAFVPDGPTCEATPTKDDAAARPALPAKPEREEPTVDTGAGATEDAERRPQRKDAPVPTADLNAWGLPRAEIPGGMTGQRGGENASKPANHPPDMAARESSEALDTCQPGTGPGRPTRGVQHAADPPPRRSISSPSEPQRHGHARGCNVQGGHRPRAHLKPRRSPTSGQQPPTHPSAQPTGGSCLADTPATTTLSTPSWRPAGAPSQRTRGQLPPAATQSHEAIIPSLHGSP